MLPRRSLPCRRRWTYVDGPTSWSWRRGRRGAGAIHGRLRLLFGHLCVDLREEGVPLHLQDARPPSLAVVLAGIAHGLVHHSLLIQEAWILRDHGHDSIFVRLLASDLPHRKPVLVEELEVVGLVLRRLLLFRHYGVDVRPHLLQCDAGWLVKGGGARSSSYTSSIVSLASLPSDELANKPGAIRLAQRAYQAATMSVNSCFCYIESLTHITLELAVMTKVVQCWSY